MPSPCQANSCAVTVSFGLKGDVIFAQGPLHNRLSLSPHGRIDCDAHWAKGTIRVQGPQRDADLGTFTSRPL